MTRQRFGARAVARDVVDGGLGLRPDFRGIALDERLRREKPCRVCIDRAGANLLRIPKLHDISLDGLSRALEVRAGEIRALQSKTQAPHVAGIVDALLHDGNHRSSSQQISSHLAGNGHRLCALRGFPH